MKEIKIGLLGLGNIGTGTYKVLEMNRKQIESAVGAPVNIVKILEKDIDRERDITVSRDCFVSDAEEIFSDPDIDIVKKYGKECPLCPKVGQEGTSLCLKVGQEGTSLCPIKGQRRP